MRSIPGGFLVLLVLLHGGTAIAEQDEDPCLDTDECRTHGRCHTVHRDGICESMEYICRTSLDCLHSGRCTPDETTEDCVSTSEADCRVSHNCNDFGRCALDVASGTCVVGRHGCRDSEACALQAHCTLRDGRCVVGSREDCAGSSECSRHGNCGFARGRCVATRAEHCREAEACTRSGRCHLMDADGEPVAALDAGGVCGGAGRCADTDACRVHGACTAGNRGECVPASTEDCARSEGCALQGRCTFLPPPEPPSESGTIMASSLLGPRGPACIVGGPEDCEQMCAGRSDCWFAGSLMGGEPACHVIDDDDRMLVPLDAGGLLRGDDLGFGGRGDRDIEGGASGTMGHGTLSIGGIGTMGPLRTEPPVDSDEDEAENDDAP
ncbi:MAG: hypothetical protein EA398_17815 [Deltaproteobacteria bacterium]|nr:MAG: hypothetical protein EA398_17815 [Deltaproteobacteria bacterium]